MNACDMIREARVRHGYSQHTVADLLGLQVRQYQRFEYGEVSLGSCRAWKVLRLCRILELDPFALVPEEDETVVIRIRATASEPAGSIVSVHTGGRAAAAPSGKGETHITQMGGI